MAPWESQPGRNTVPAARLPGFLGLPTRLGRSWRFVLLGLAGVAVLAASIVLSRAR